ncbi:isopeptide-forming domain-containing fimbrial protein, partial [Paucisalibacillus sp. EB02]|uniref:isopeptide-forming domain-containing fimbrial protein n=1 Tax=Paucisalibacillus sp. EB02 TaxID=1347087 RepID=UPI0005AAF51E
RSRNTLKESLVTNLVISDVLPEGLTFVEGSLKASHEGTADFANGTIIANFGDVSDVEWRAVTFQATIDSGQVGNTLQNIATVDGDNLEVPDKPENEITVDPKEPVLESRKTATLTEKTEGNTDIEHAEVGDVLTYTIETRNTKDDSLITNLVISDTLPEGLEYVAGSLTVDGQEATDSEDEDNGSFAGGEVVGHFGDVTDTEWHTVTFQVVVGEGQASKDIINTAVVEGDNVDTPDQPEHELLVYPRYPVLEAEKTAVNVKEGKENYEAGDTVHYTIKARNTVKDSVVEDLVISDVLPEGLTFVEGSIEVSHEGSVDYKDGTIMASFGDVTDTEWRTVTFQAQINSNQYGKSIENIATVDAGNIETPVSPSKEIIVDKEVTVTPEEPDNPDNDSNPPNNNDTEIKEPESGNELPKTATNNYNILLLGAILTLIGLIIWFTRRKMARH